MYYYVRLLEYQLLNKVHTSQMSGGADSKSTHIPISLTSSVPKRLLEIKFIHPLNVYIFRHHNFLNRTT